MSPKKIIIIGPGHPLRGGLANFDHRLCRQFLQEGYDCSIFSYSLQYPSILFPGKTQYAKGAGPTDIEIYSVINSIHPLNWIQVGHELKRLKPDLIIVRYWIPFLAPALGTIIRRAKKNNHTRIIALIDNAIPHEKRLFDKAFTRYFFKGCDGFVTMSENVLNDLRTFEKDKPAIQVVHPLFDTFGQPVSKEEARQKLGIDSNEKILLFFGFIRHYKGLDILLEALSRLPVAGCRLLVAGEFYEDAQKYRQQIEQLGIAEKLILRTGFIPDDEVRYYLCAADVVVQPYRSATQSGVTPLAYYYEKPMIVTHVGSLASFVPHEKAGLVCEPDPSSIAQAINRFFELGEQYFIPHLRKEKEKYSWQQFTRAITSLAQQL